MTGSWLHFKGLEIANVPMNTRSQQRHVRVNDASNNTFELLNIHHGIGAGLFIDNGTGGNLILNCDSHDNYDRTAVQGDGQNADGFGVHYQTTGPSTIIRGCRAWWNSDDGYDLISQEVPVTIENSLGDGQRLHQLGHGAPADGNGNGFKMGSSQTGIRHIVQEQRRLEEQGGGLLRQPFVGREQLVQQHVVQNGTQYNMLASTSMPTTPDGRPSP